MRIGDMFESKYISANQVQQSPAIGIIHNVAIETVQSPGGAQRKPVMYFSNGCKPLILKPNHCTALMEIFGTDEPAQLVGRAVEMYFDPNIEFSGKRVGGVRLRAPSNQPQQFQQPNQTQPLPPTQPYPQSYPQQQPTRVQQTLAGHGIVQPQAQQQMGQPVNVQTAAAMAFSNWNEVVRYAAEKKVDIRTVMSHQAERGFAGKFAPARDALPLKTFIDNQAAHQEDYGADTQVIEQTLTEEIVN